jgi:hypothetical protein
MCLMLPSKHLPNCAILQVVMCGWLAQVYVTFHFKVARACFDKCVSDECVSLSLAGLSSSCCSQNCACVHVCLYLMSVCVCVCACACMRVCLCAYVCLYVCASSVRHHLTCLCVYVRTCVGEPVPCTHPYQERRHVQHAHAPHH